MIEPMGLVRTRTTCCFPDIWGSIIINEMIDLVGEIIEKIEMTFNNKLHGEKDHAFLFHIDIQNIAQLIVF